MFVVILTSVIDLIIRFALQSMIGVILFLGGATIISSKRDEAPPQVVESTEQRCLTFQLMLWTIWKRT